MPEKHEAVTVCGRIGRVYDLDRFVVEVEVFLSLEERLRGPRRLGCGRLFTRGCAHAVQRIIMGDDLRPVSHIGEIARDVGSGYGGAGPANGDVAPREIRMVMRIDDVLQRLIRELADRGNNLVV